MNHNYIGRFAPSPTGPMHLGTLIAAVASYLQAKKNGGTWLVRMEDVDVLRNVEGMDNRILHSLEAFGFEWDGEVLYQTTRTDAYQQALDSLIEQDLVFPCTCSRRLLANDITFKESGIYPGTCRNKRFPFEGEHAIRLRADELVIDFDDAVMDRQREDLADDCGDFVIRRRDGLFAYQLAVVVDDAFQGVTEVVRGADLLDSTARQIYLHQCLGYPVPDHFHFPLILGEDGDKLSKHTGAAAIDDDAPIPALIASLQHLGQHPPETLQNASLDEFWAWAIEHWSSTTIPRDPKRF